MTVLRLALASLSAGFLLSASPCSAQPAKTDVAAASADSVEPQALQALKRMGAYLGALTSFEIDTQTSLDVVTNAGERVQLNGTGHYKVQRPTGFVIDVATDMKSRRFYFDGKQLTVLSPLLGYYATAPAPGNNAQAIDTLSQRYGITLPLSDLFSWVDQGSVRADQLKSGFLVGPATIDGVLTDQYAFREADVDWQIWIQRGDAPLPRKLVIDDHSDPATPAYDARLSWTINPTLNASEFTYRPDQSAKQIRLSILNQ